MTISYRELKQKARNCRDRDVRIKVDLFCLVLKLGNVSEACGRRGFSRKFYYKWWKRFKKSKFELWGLEEESRKPKSSPNRITDKIEKAIRYYQRRQYGARMTQAMLRREKILVGKSTINRVFNGRKNTKINKRNQLNPHNRRYELVIPGQRLQLDVKYVPEFVNGRRVYNYVAVDECTRWRFAWGYYELNEHWTEDFLNRLKEACPFPIDTIQTDNGFEFTFALNPNIARIHQMDSWCAKQRIKHRLIPPGAKELNGKVERSHRIDEQYFYWKAPTTTLDEFNKAQAKWLRFYNTIRPHGGIGYLTPNEKLDERKKVLQTEKVETNLDQLRIRFLKEAPMNYSKQDRQIKKLELELKKLLNAA